MDYRELLSKLVSEKEKLERAIAAVRELVDQTAPRRRGRPAKNLVGAAMPHAPRKRKPFSAATKRKMSLAQKRRYAKRKAAEVKA